MISKDTYERLWEGKRNPAPPRSELPLLRTPVAVGRRRYVVVHDAMGIIRIEYTNAVNGTRNLDQFGATAKRVRAAFSKL